jgi:hypothetical protein
MMCKACDHMRIVYRTNLPITPLVVSIEIAQHIQTTWDDARQKLEPPLLERHVMRVTCSGKPFLFIAMSKLRMARITYPLID